MEQFLYLTTTGWKSGKKHKIEIWFMEHNGNYYVMSEGRESAHWVKNITHNPKISFRVAGRSFEGAGRLVQDSEPVAAEIKKLMKKKYGWDEGLIVELVPG